MRRLGPRQKSCPELKTLNFSTEKKSRGGRRDPILRETDGAVPRGMLLLPATVLVVCLGVCTVASPRNTHAPDVWAVVNGHGNQTGRSREVLYKARINPEAQETSPEEVLSGKLNDCRAAYVLEILLERAKELNLEASDGEVEDKFTELRSGYTAKTNFKEILKDGGMTVDDLKKDLRRQLSIQKLLNP